MLPALEQAHEKLDERARLRNGQGYVMGMDDGCFPLLERDYAREYARYRLQRSRLERVHGVDLLCPIESCGVGMVAEIDGSISRRVIDLGVRALGAISHRGAVDSDGKSGDGAGIHFRLPQEFFHRHIARAGHRVSNLETRGSLAVGMVFLPRNDHARQERCRTILESQVIRMGYKIYGWRQVPIVVSALGRKAESTRPEIEQIMIENARRSSEDVFERDLYVLRRRVEKAAEGENLSDFYICSLSCRSIIYKGLFLAEQLSNFYPDLSHPLVRSDFAIYHQRFSTNTFPEWWLAQPFRIVAHNGEVNTLKGNKKWMSSHEAQLRYEKTLGYASEEIKPILPQHGSDSACLDSAFEMLLRFGRGLPEAKSLLMPQAWEQDEVGLSPELRDFYRWNNGLMEPWDGPAAVCAFDGRWVLSCMDRNGLRPLRYLLTDDGLLVSGSEAGIVPIADESIIEKGHVGPGEMVAVDLDKGELLRDAALKDMCAKLRPYKRLVSSIKRMSGAGIDGKKKVARAPKSEAASAARVDGLRLRRCQSAFGWTFEDIELILKPMSEKGLEPTGSMGDDAPLAVLVDQARPLHHFFRQDFSQVTNPPIDSLREKRVMDLRTRIGNFVDLALLEEGSRGAEKRGCIYEFASPILSSSDFYELRSLVASTDLHCVFSTTGASNGESIKRALESLCAQAEEAVRAGRGDLFLSDSGVCEDMAAIPAALAVSALHSHLQQRGLRSYASINVESGQCLDVHSFAVLIGLGATTISPWLAEATICEGRSKIWSSKFQKDKSGAGARAHSLALEQQRCISLYCGAIDAGLLKIMSKMGIAVISSYRGAVNFEAIGLSRALVAEYFPGLVSRISGIGLSGLERRTIVQHEKGFSFSSPLVPIGGFYRFRSSEQRHAWQGDGIHHLQEAARLDSRSHYDRYCALASSGAPVALRDLLDFEREGVSAIALEEVESVTRLRRRLVSPGISHGALSAEAHETLAIAMNRIGAKSDSGEGGEDPRRYLARAGGENASSAIKQIASGRFGVTADYLNHCLEIEIKMAQGAKPGEGGQLPGHKVTDEIAALRRSMAGVTLISPPPHHDIYSIEDIAQLIYDLKQINPLAEVCVKLVARTGIGTIAAGLAKAQADTILISGHSGGTGASPQSSIKYAGLPWEIGLAEVHQVLSVNGFREKVRLRVDGGIKTGRDVVMAALLGGEEFGIGTASLVAMGCLMVRQCHANTCPVGICTQDKKLREHFRGTPDHVINLFTFIAEEVREILASLGASSLDEIIGCTELLTQISRGDSSLDDLDMNSLLARVEMGTKPMYCTRARGVPNAVTNALDERIIEDASPLFSDGSAVDLRYSIRNIDRTIGAGLSSQIVRRLKGSRLAEGHVRLRFQGTAGQSFGAWSVCGMRMLVEGEANDYVGKGLSGAVIVIRPPTGCARLSESNAIVGNTVLYGATSGKLFVAGCAGERFAVRNSGAIAVVEGCGSNGCEYMTGGEVLVLGRVGANFAAGMTGGIAYVYDSTSEDSALLGSSAFLSRYNDVHVEVYHLSGYWESRCRELLSMHVKETHSSYARGLLEDWDRVKRCVWQVVPKETLGRLSHALAGEPIVKDRLKKDGRSASESRTATLLPLLPDAAE